jgi:uncharacterized membrane protein
MTQNRWRSKAAWVAMFALAGFLLGNWGLFEKIGLTNEGWQTFVELLLAALAAFGVFNNPTVEDRF